ncbi:collagen alpha-1(III) chain-like [Anas acuta]|uniref:collagen alpha-1(III) chain-like n=1 Tax=Anas acuta TaxID=28680 RepID=UPI0035C8A378
MVLSVPGPPGDPPVPGGGGTWGGAQPCAPPRCHRSHQPPARRAPQPPPKVPPQSCATAPGCRGLFVGVPGAVTGVPGAAPQHGGGHFEPSDARHVPPYPGARCHTWHRDPPPRHLSPPHAPQSRASPNTPTRTLPGGQRGQAGGAGGGLFQGGGPVAACPRGRVAGGAVRRCHVPAAARTRIYFYAGAARVVYLAAPFPGKSSGHAGGGHTHTHRGGGTSFFSLCAPPFCSQLGAGGAAGVRTPPPPPAGCWGRRGFGAPPKCCSPSCPPPPAPPDPLCGLYGVLGSLWGRGHAAWPGATVGTSCLSFPPPCNSVWCCGKGVAGGCRVAPEGGSHTLDPPFLSPRDPADGGLGPRLRSGSWARPLAGGPGGVSCLQSRFLAASRELRPPLGPPPSQPPPPCSSWPGLEAPCCQDSPFPSLRKGKRVR